jgi:hypothetical protein
MPTENMVGNKNPRRPNKRPIPLRPMAKESESARAMLIQKPTKR